MLFGLEPTTFGVLGIVSGASIVFFAYIGLDVVPTTLVVTGMVKYDRLDPEAALAQAFESVGRPGYAILIAAARRS